MNQAPEVSGESVFEVVWPSGKLVSEPIEPAPAVLDLNGKTVCELWDWVFKGDEMYAVLNEELRKKYPDMRIVDHKILGNSHSVGAREFLAKLPALLRQYRCDAVISAVGA